MLYLGLIFEYDRLTFSIRVIIFSTYKLTEHNRVERREPEHSILVIWSLKQDVAQLRAEITYATYTMQPRITGTLLIRPPC